MKVNLKAGDFDLRGYDVIRTQFFSSASITGMSISKNGIRFSSACVRKFASSEYIEMLVHPQKQIIAVKPCSENHKNAMCWARICEDGIRVRSISGAAFIKTLYEIFDWNYEYRYRLRGAVNRSEGNLFALFDAKKPEIFTSRYQMKMPWASGFGNSYYFYQSSKVTEPLFDTYSEYNNEPNLQPTLPEVANENARLLIKQFKNNGGFSCDGADILT